MAKRFIRRGFRGRRRRIRGSWVLDTFNSNLDVDVVAGNVRFPHILSLFEKNDYQESSTTIQKGSTLLHAHVDLQWHFRPLVSGAGSALWLMPTARWALLIADFDDSDPLDSVAIIDNPAQNTLMQGGVRVLRIGQVGGMVLSPSAAIGTGETATAMQPHTVIKWSGRARVPPDSALYLNLWLTQPTTDVTSWLQVTVDTWSRCYVRAN